MVNVPDELSELSHDELQCVIYSHFFIASLLFTWICHLDLSKLRLIASSDRCHA